MAVGSWPVAAALRASSRWRARKSRPRQPGAHRGGVLADARREDERVDAAEDRRIRPDVLADAVGEALQRQLRRAVPRACALSRSRTSPLKPERPSSPLWRLSDRPPAQW